MPDPTLQNALNSIPLELLKNLWELFKAYWWFWLLILAIRILAEFIPIMKKRIRLNKRFSSIDRINSDKDILYKLRKLCPSDFEHYIADLYSRLGYKTEVVGKSHDGGVDVIAEKDGVKHYIQCKKFITSKVRVGAVRDFFGAMNNELATGKGIFITTNVFTTEAENFGDGNPIELIDGYALLKLVKSVDSDQSDIPLAAGIQIEKCPQCGGELKKRISRFGKFIGCSNYPKCKFIEKRRIVKL